MTLVDTHTHLDSVARSGGLPDLVRRARAAGVEWMIAVGTEPGDWDLYRDISRENRGCIRHTVGVHPCSVDEGWESAVSGIEKFWTGGGADAPVALGECGLDRFHLPKEPAAAERALGLQRAAFKAQLAVARRLGCAVVIHSRGAFGECVGMIDESGVDWGRVVFHCFSEDEAQVLELSRRGGRASFTGILTYKNADPVRRAARAQGLGRLMIETDAPFLAPAPHRGKPNEPAYLRHTAEYAAGMLGVTLDELAAATTATARAFFGF
ncbi:MAG TPA: TatD family hydrolase [Opitutaceae bacterium]|nr:TatD family hydrolase [Opitutaceae bacterium]